MLPSLFPSSSLPTPGMLYRHTYPPPPPSDHRSRSPYIVWGVYNIYASDHRSTGGQRSVPTQKTKLIQSLTLYVTSSSEEELLTYHIPTIQNAHSIPDTLDRVTCNTYHPDSAGGGGVMGFLFLILNDSHPLTVLQGEWQERATCKAAS